MSNYLCTELFLAPHAEQAKELAKLLAACRITANELNEFGRDIITGNAQEMELAGKLKEEGIDYQPHIMKFPGQFDFVNKAREVRETNLWMRDLYATCINATGWDTYDNFQDYFRRKKAGIDCGLPRFKSASRYDTFRYPAYGQYEVTEELNKGKNGSKIHLGGIGDINVINPKCARGILSKGIPKQAIVKRYKGYHKNKWSVIIYYDTVEPRSCGELREFPRTPASIDIGARKTAVVSDGTRVENLHPLKKMEKEVAKVQRQLSELDPRVKENRLPRRKKTAVLRHMFGRMNDIKKNHLHQASRKVVMDHDVLVIEDLMVTDINNLNDSKQVHKEFSDASPGMFMRMVRYKAAEAGTVICKVDPAYTSQDCSVCGARNDPGSSETYRCRSCGFTGDRDDNACQNLLRRWMGLAIHGPSVKTT